MSIKDDFLAALDADFPSALNDLLDRTIPNIPTIGWPTEVEDAIIAQGQLASNINVILKQFEGLPVVQMMMHLGQKNRTVQNLLLTSLEYLERGGGDFDIVSPLSGQVFAPSPAAFMCVVNITHGFLDFVRGVVEVSGRSFPLIGSGKLLMAEITLPYVSDIPNKDTWSLSYTLNVTCFFKSTMGTKSVPCTFKNA
jgi:hypothetical protein